LRLRSSVADEQSVFSRPAQVRPREDASRRRQIFSPHDKVFSASLGGLIVLAWISLVAWGLSPYGRFLSHEELGEVGANDGHVVVLFVAAWTLMTVAMMLPTSWPLLTLFNTITRQRDDRGRLLTLVIAGYLGVWMLFGLVVHAGDRVLHEVVENSAWMSSHAWLVGAATFLLTGAYQFTPLKYRCLEKCRSPFSFIAGTWHGVDARKEALLLGFRHGIFCVGCCWSLMLLMFVVGVGNLAWMLALGAIMSIEKNARWGRQLSAPLGAWLIASGVGVVFLSASPFQ
jgi:predicted metal-binding membrane protein